MNYPFVSVIIPVRNGQYTLGKCIDSVFELDYGNYEVIVVNDASVDNTAEIVSGYPNLKILNTSGIGPSGARNLAVEQAEGEFIAFSDADCLLDKYWLRELLKGFTNEKIAGVGGTQKSPDDDSEFGKRVNDFLGTAGFITDYIKSGLGSRRVKHNPSCNVMYRKSTLIEVGGFLEGLWPGEDVELDYRIRKKGYLLMFNPKAIVFHYRPNNFRDFSKMMFRYGKSQGILVRKYGFFRKVHFVPLVIILLVLFLFYNAPFGSLLLAFIAMAIVLKLIKKPKKFPFMGWLFLITIFNWNFGFLYGLFKKYD